MTVDHRTTSEEIVLTTASLAKKSLRLAAGCSVALLVATSSGAAFAHGSGNHNDDNHHNGNGGSWSHTSERHHHHHHHHHKTTDNGPPLHGAGSSHNPIVYHPPVKPITKPVAGVGPAKPSPSPMRPKPVTFGGSGCHVGHRIICPRHPGPQITDHRNGKTCSYTYGNWASYQQYLTCEGN